MKKVIHIDPRSSKPKYRQIIESICQSVDRKSLIKGEKVPSINQICSEFNLSRDTVMIAFNELKAKGILKSQPGKGYYIVSTEIFQEGKIFVLFDELNAFKEDLYNSFINTLKGKATVEIYFHHFNFRIFKSLITESIGNYTSYVIMPANFENTNHLISKLPKDKVFILDRLKPDLKNYPVVYQHFEQDLFDAMMEGLNFLKKYRKLVFVHPGGKEPEQRVNGFERFCKEYEFNYEVVRTLTGIRPGLYEAYFLISDRDLVEMIKIVKEYKYKLGKKFGIVSFNDSILKEVVSGGITTISTDFKEMGKTLANMVMERKIKQIKNPSRLIIRKSL